MRKPLQIMAFVLCAAAVVGGFSLLRAKRRTQGMQCAANLTSISSASRQYPSDHEETFPHSFLEMSNELSHRKF